MSCERKDLTVLSGWSEGDEGKFADFSDPVRRAMNLALAEAVGFNHGYVGTEHLLLGLVGDPESVGTRVLIQIGLDLGTVQRAVEFIVGRRDGPVPEVVGLTPRSNRIIELMIAEARHRRDESLGTEHLLLALLREGEGIAAGVLESLGITIERVERALPAVRASAEPEEPSTDVAIVYIDEADRIRVLSGVRATDGRIAVNTSAFAEILTTSILTTRRLKEFDAIDQFERLINSNTVAEADLQAFLEGHPDFLLGSEYESLHSQVVLTRTQGDDLRPDFLLKPISGVSYEPAIVELKLPGQLIIKPTPRREGVYAKILEAVMQLRTYAEFFRERENRDYVRGVLGFTAYRPRLVLVVGRNIEDADQEVRAAVFDSMRPVELLTYEDILSRYRRLVLMR